MVISKENVFKLSKRLKILTIHLLNVISESMEEYTEIGNADFQQVQEYFKEIADFFIRATGRIFYTDIVAWGYWNIFIRVWDKKVKESRRSKRNLFLSSRSRRF